MKTAVFAAGWLLTTTMLVSVTLPVLLTVPVNNRAWPGATGPVGQVLVTLMPGVRTFAQVVVVVAVTILGKVVKRSEADATIVAMLGAQGFLGI